MPPGRQCHWREHPAAWNHLATNHSADGHGALMTRSYAVAALLSFTLNAWADGPGTRIRDTPLPSRPAAAVDRDLQRCEAMRGDEKERCLRAARCGTPGRASAARGPRARAWTGVDRNGLRRRKHRPGRRRRHDRRRRRALVFVHRSGLNHRGDHSPCRAARACARAGNRPLRFHADPADDAGGHRPLARRWRPARRGELCRLPRRRALGDGAAGANRPCSARVTRHTAAATVAMAFADDMLAYLAPARSPGYRAPGC